MFSIVDNLELKISNLLTLFDTLLAPILKFGSEIWGMHKAKDIQSVDIRFLRRLCVVKKHNSSFTM